MDRKSKGKSTENSSGGGGSDRNAERNLAELFGKVTYSLFCFIIVVSIIVVWNNCR